MDDKEGTKQALKFLILSPSYQGVKRLFVLSLEDEAGWKGHKILSSNCRNKRP